MADLNRNIVIKSRFSVPYGNNRGSRGGTPGDYIKRYMARPDAVENDTPTRLKEADATETRFDARSQIIREAGAEPACDEDSIPRIRRRMKKAQRNGGVAFTNRDCSLSDEKFMDISADFQRHFNAGKTAIETIISFTDEYLRENGCLDPDFVFERAGDYRGHIDQIKLRMAISKGVEKMGRNFDDLRFIGCIQVDTAHVHCHLVMMDYGIGTIASDGMQRGKLSGLDKRNLRRGIDTFLDEKQTVKMMSSSVMYDKRNALCYIKKFVHQTMAQQGIPQFLIACLPRNSNYWSANSHRKEMRKANAIVRDFVVNVLQPEPNAASDMYREARQSIERYADVRQKREGFDENERMRFIRNGEEDLIKDCMNGVYSVLKKIPRDELTVRTPMLDVMSMDDEIMASESVNDPMIEFGFRLRSYSSRLNTHRNLYRKYRDEYRSYEKQEDKDPAAERLARYLQYERDYQQRLMVKYQYFLSFLPPDAFVEGEFENLMRQGDRVRNMEKMTVDPAFQQMGNAAADHYGMCVYGINRGSQIKNMPSVWMRRVEMEQEKYATAAADFRERLHEHGFEFDGHGVTRQKLYSFDEVKALDLHHLGYDFPGDIQVSKININRFVQAADERYSAFYDAKEYLDRTGQSDSMVNLPVADVLAMKRFADQLSFGGNGIPSQRTVSQNRRRNMATVRLGKDYSVEMKDMVHTVVETTKFFMDNG